jgi:hypothetical protein
VVDSLLSVSSLRYDARLKVTPLLGGFEFLSEVDFLPECVPFVSLEEVVDTRATLLEVESTADSCFYAFLDDLLIDLVSSAM